MPRSNFSTRWRGFLRQFEASPYPDIASEDSPADDPWLLWTQSMITGYYHRDRRVPSVRGRWILDAGCGTGYKTLALAQANSGARIVGIDASRASVARARRRVAHHRALRGCEIHVMCLEDVAKLGRQFDYINCDETLYLVPDPVAALCALRSVLSPRGVIRVNFHSRRQRQPIFNCQDLAAAVGLMDGRAPRARRFQEARSLVNAISANAILRAKVWDRSLESSDERLGMNFLLEGDKGWTMKEFSAALSEAGLKFIQMVRASAWSLERVFPRPEQIPRRIAARISKMSPSEIVGLVEMIHPSERLLDLWCYHEGLRSPRADTSDRGIFQARKVMLHPAIRCNELRAALEKSMSEFAPLTLPPNLMAFNGCFDLSADFVPCLWELTKGPRTIESLVDLQMRLFPRDLKERRARSRSQARTRLLEQLGKLERAALCLVCDHSTGA